MELQQIGKVVVEKIVGGLLEWVLRPHPEADKPGAIIRSNDEDLRSALSEHWIWVENWSAEVDVLSFVATGQPKYLESVFTPLDVFVQPQRSRWENDEEVQIIPLEDAICGRHVVLFGHPGAGKTTSLKHLCQRLLRGEDFLPGLQFPLVIRLRDLNTRTSQVTQDVLFTRIQELLGIRIDFPLTKLTPELVVERQQIRRRYVCQALNSANLLLLIDGLDELPPSLRKRVIMEARELLLSLSGSLVIMTSRTGEVDCQFETASHYEISPLSARQIYSLAETWLGSKRVKDFIAAAERTPFWDTARRPLVLTLLCGTFDRKGELPEKPTSVYRTVVDILIERWDSQNSVPRSSYARLDTTGKFKFLSHLAFALTTKVGGTVFKRNDLVNAYSFLYRTFRLPENEAERVASELETHTGLLLQVSYDSYEFSHKSVQEYLTAEYVVRLSTPPASSELLVSLPNELAIATALSSEPAAYLEQLFRQIRNVEVTRKFLFTFLDRLLLEKVDFEVTERAGVTLLGFYSHAIGLYLAAEARGGAPARDIFFETLPSLEALVRERLPIDQVLEIYSIQLEAPLLDKQRKILIIRRPQHLSRPGGSELARLLMFHLPAQLFVRKALIQDSHGA